MAISSAPFMFRDFQHWTAYRDSSFFREMSEWARAQYPTP
jgi:TRAP-type C4-dicarboxylate transport system substrate-binding protein